PRRLERLIKCPAVVPDGAGPSVVSEGRARHETFVAEVESQPHGKRVAVPANRHSDVVAGIVAVVDRARGNARAGRDDDEELADGRVDHGLRKNEGLTG